MDVLSGNLCELRLDALLDVSRGDIFVVLHNEAHSVGLDRARANVLVLRVQSTVLDIALDRLIKEQRLLLHN